MYTKHIYINVGEILYNRTIIYYISHIFIWKVENIGEIYVCPLLVII